MCAAIIKSSIVIRENYNFSNPNCALHSSVFHFFTIFEMKNVRGAIGWGLGKKLGAIVFFDYDAILRLHASIEILRSRFFVNVA